MVIKKASASAAKPAAKGVTSKVSPAKAAPKPEPVDEVLEPITVQKTYSDDGGINEDAGETIAHAVFPANARTGRVTVMVGTSEDYGKIKASVTVSAPYMVEEFDDAKNFALTKAQETLDELADVTAVEEDDPAPAKATGKKGGKGKPADEEPDDDDSGDGDVELFDSEELQAMDEDGLKEICGQWDIEYPTSKKASVRKAEAIAAILEAQEAAGEDGDGGEDGGEGEEDGIGPDEINAMDRKQVEAFLVEYNEGVDDEDDQLEVDLTEYPKTKAGLASLKADLIGALFAEE